MDVLGGRGRMPQVCARHLPKDLRHARPGNDALMWPQPQPRASWPRCPVLQVDESYPLPKSREDLMHFRWGVQLQRTLVLRLKPTGQPGAPLPSDTLPSNAKAVLGMAAQRRLAVCMIETCASTSLPCNRSVMPQDHFNYAATWWTLSAATLALAVKAVRQGIRAA